MSEYETLRMSVPGISKPRRLWDSDDLNDRESIKDVLQNYVYSISPAGIPTVTPVIPARRIMTEEEQHTDPNGTKRMVRFGPDMILDFETKNNPANITTLLDFQEHNIVIIYKGELADIRIKGIDTYDIDPTPIVKIERESRTYTAYKNTPKQVYRTREELSQYDPTPAQLQYVPLDGDYFLGDIENTWSAIDNQLAVNCRDKGGRDKDKPVYVKVPKISLDFRKSAIRGFASLYPERILTERDIMIEQFPEWESLSEAQKDTDPFEELVDLLRPFNDYTGLSNEEYRGAVKLCLTGVLVGMASRQFKPTMVDVFPILSGEQGTGKTTFCRFMGADISSLETFTKSLFERAPFKGEIERSASDESGNRHADNKIWERSSLKLISEFVEGMALRPSTINTFKALADKTTAIYPRLYENEHEEDITTTFWVTTNEPNPLYDVQNRRFFSIRLEGDQNNPSPLVTIIRERDPEGMERLYDLLIRVRAHSRHLVEEGHRPIEYWTEEFRHVQRTVNGQIVTISPMELKIGNIIKRDAETVITNLGVNIDNVYYAPASEVYEALIDTCSTEIPNSYRQEFIKAFKNAWNNRTKYGISKDSGGGVQKWINGRNVRSVCLIDSDGEPIKTVHL